MNEENETAEFNVLKSRLDEIVEAVSQDDIPLDEALGLYEEAVNIGLAACDASEFIVEPDDAADSASGGIEPAQSNDRTDGASDGVESSDIIDVSADVTSVAEVPQEASASSAEEQTER